MHKFIVTLVLILSLVSTTFTANVARAGGCDTGTVCDAYQNGQGHMSPAIPNLVCVTFVQQGADKVVLNFYKPGMYDYTNPRNPSNHPFRILPKVAGPNGEFCVGKQWFEQAEWIMICNGENYYDLRVSYAKDQISSGTVYTCLLGDGACPALQ